MQQRWTTARVHFPFLVIVWPLCALLLLAGLWSVTLVRAGQERARLEAAALAEVRAAAQAYEQYVTRSVASMDQVSMQLKQSWEQSGGTLRLDDMTREGMFLDSAFACVAILDKQGALRTAIRAHACGAALPSADFFAYHRDNNTSALRIGPPAGMPTSAHEAILFSRRIDRPDGQFDGVVLAAVRADYLTAFYMSSTPGRGGMVATVGAESGLRVEQHHDGAAAPTDTVLPYDAGLWNGESGAALVRERYGFPDGRARVLGWHRSPVYPLVGLVAVSHAQALDGYAGFWSDARGGALFGSILIVLLATVATTLAHRAALRDRAKEDVRRAYRTATEGANDGFYMCNPVYDAGGTLIDFDIVDCNERGARFYGIGRQALIGQRLSSMDSGGDETALFDAYRLAMDTGFHEDERLMPEHNRLNITWGKRRIVRVGNGLAITLQDVSERKAHVAELKRLSDEDLLTGLPNRQWLMNYLPNVLVQALVDGTEVALLFIDLDDFTYVNDAHGHAAGDGLLKAAAQRLTSLLRPTDCVVRFGGDQFIVLLMPADSDAQTERVAARIVDAFGAPFAVGPDLLEIAVSVGIALFNRDGNDAAELIKAGGIAMDAAKSGGKGQYRVYEASLARTMHTQALMKQSLLDAIDQDQFVLYYQPRVDARSGKLCSMEALLRWIHPQRGLVAPLDFIPLAEASGLILRIGELVMDKACAQLAAWRLAGLPLVPVSINVSPKQFARGEVHRQLQLCLERHDTPPALLEVEITESAMMGDQQYIIAQLAAIRALGVKLHVDDFGTGYSSLSQLQKLKMDVLKVDRAFTAELGQSREGQVFFQAIVSMAHALGMSVVAEGVETAAQLRILQELDCNEVQGYYIARPMPAAQMAALLRQGVAFPHFLAGQTV
jgi:diguanylate cyclase (GGDEF)-like protein